MIEENGRVELNDDGIWQKRADGSLLQFTDAIGRKFSPPLPYAVFDAWRRVKLISQDMRVPAEQGIVFVPTRTALKFLPRHRRSFPANHSAGVVA